MLLLYRVRPARITRRGRKIHTDEPAAPAAAPVAAAAAAATPAATPAVFASFKQLCPTAAGETALPLLLAADNTAAFAL